MVYTMPTSGKNRGAYLVRCSVDVGNSVVIGTPKFPSNEAKASEIVG